MIDALMEVCIATSVVLLAGCSIVSCCSVLMVAFRAVREVLVIFFYFEPGARGCGVCVQIWLSFAVMFFNFICFVTRPIFLFLFPFY